MSGYGKYHSPDDERAEASRSYPEGLRGELTVAEAAVVLGVSERHSYRIKAKIRKEGVKGVIHGNRGRICQRKLSEKTQRCIVGLAGGKYRGFI